MALEFTDQAQDKDWLRFSQFFDRHLSNIDRDSDGQFNLQEVCNAVGQSYLTGGDADIAGALLQQFYEISEQDSFLSVTIGRKDLEKLDQRIVGEKFNRQEAIKAANYLTKHYDELAKPKSKGIYEDDIRTKLQSATSAEERTILNHLLRNFNKIGNCSGDEYIWEKRRISKADIAAYPDTAYDSLATNARFFSKDKLDWIPDEVAFERRRLANAISSWPESDKNAVKSIGDAMTAGDLDQLVKAVRSVNPPSNLKAYAEVLNSVYATRERRYNYDYTYKVHVSFQQSDTHLGGKPSLVFSSGSDYQFRLRIPLESEGRPNAQILERQGPFTRERTEREITPDFVGLNISMQITDPEKRSNKGHVGP